MANVKTMILNWEIVGATVACADSIVQAEFFKGFAGGLGTYESDYHAQLQIAYAASQKGDNGQPILTKAMLKTLENGLACLSHEEA